MGTSCGQGVSIEHSMMRFFLSVVLAGAALADSEPYTIDRWPMVMAMVSLLELTTAMALSLDMEPLVTVAMLAMEVSMVATEVTMASVRLTLMPTLLAKLPSAFLWPMPTLLAILTMLESSLEWVTPDTEVMLDMEVTIMDSMASV